MPIVQAAIVHAVSLLGDSPGIFILVSFFQASAQLAYTRSETQADPAGELAAFRSMQPKQNVSYCHTSSRRKSCRGLLMAGFLRDMQ